MFAGLLKEKIEVLKYVKTTNDYGETIDTLHKEYECRAKVIRASGARQVINHEIQYPYNKTFVIRIHVPIHEDNFIRWQNKLYRILSIDRDRDMQQTVVQTEIVNE